MRKTKHWLMTIATLLCSVCVSAATYSDWTSTNKGQSSTTSSNTYNITANAGDVLTFDWLVSSEANYDKLIITIGGTEILNKSGELSGTYQHTFTSSDTYAMVVKYTKDGSVDRGSDYAKVYNITLTTEDTGDSGDSGTDNVIASGTCGTNLTWELTNEGELIIEGSGNMSNYNYYNSPSPWSDYSIYIRNATLKDGVTSIGESAFFRCSQLTSITIPNSVTSIGSNAFYDCSKLTTITIPEGVKTVGSSTFERCTSLVSVVLPNSITNINYYAFYGCSNLKNINIPNGVTSIGSSAFQDCIGLVNITIPSKNVGSYAFQGCTNLSNVVFESGVTNIAKGAFAGCVSIKKLRIEDDVETLSINAGDGYNKGMFYDCPLEILYLGRNLEYNTTSDYGYSPFRGVNTLRLVTIGDCVTSIGEYIFSGCSGITSVISKAEVPPTCTSSTFNGVSRSIPVSVPSDAIAAYNTTDYWKEFKNLNSIVKTVTSGICGNNLIWKLTYEGELIITGDGAMNDYKYYELPWYDYKTTIEKVTISDGVVSIGNNAFYGCSNISSISLPETIIEIGDYAFRNCSTLPAIVIPSSVMKIGEGSFYDCRNLFTVTIPENVSRIGNAAFHNTAWYDSKANGVVYIGNVLYEYKGAPSFGTSIEIKEGTISISPLAFQGCSSITSVAIPNSVESIGDYAFNGCNNLTSITCDAANPPICFSSTFTNIDKTIPVYVPTNSVAIYKSKDYWKEFVNIIRNDLIASGEYGNHFWLLTTEGELIIEGTGNMENSSWSEYPWAEHRTCIKKVTICDGVESIGWEAFRGYNNITTVTIPNSVTSIMSYALRDCSSIISITIPESVTFIGTDVFRNCSGELFVNCDISSGDYEGADFSKVTIGEKVASLGQSAFSDCTDLTTIIFPENSELTDIGVNAFRNCSSLTSITIPESVINIGGQAFYGCNNLTAITCESVIPPTIGNSYTFYGVNKSIPVYVPASSVSAYQSAAYWSEFTNIQPIVEPVPSAVTITMNQYGSGTYCSLYALDFSEVEGLKAYAATGYNTSTGVVTLTRVMTSKPGMGLFIKGEPGEYTVPTLESTDDNSLNMLVGTLENTHINGCDGQYYNYRYTIKDGEEEQMFYTVDDGYTISAGEAYLQIPISWMPAETKAIGLRFDDGEATDIEEKEFIIQDPAAIFDLMGRRVTHPLKGNIYIVNGKKVIWE